jgi:hypothetical protein
MGDSRGRSQLTLEAWRRETTWRSTTLAIEFVALRDLRENAMTAVEPNMSAVVRELGLRCGIV